MAEEEEKVFHPTRANWIFYCVILVLQLAIFFKMSEKSAYQYGVLSGTLVLFLLIPYLLGWAGWRISGRKRRVGAAVFSIVLSLLVIGHSARLSQKLHEKKRQDAVYTETRAMERKLRKIADPEAEDPNADVVERVESLPESLSEEQKWLVTESRQFVEKGRSQSRGWINSLRSVNSADMMDPSLMESVADLESRIRRVDRYLSRTETYLEFTKKGPEQLKKQLMRKGVEETAIDKYLEKLLKSNLKIRTPMIEMLMLHRQNGQAFKDLLQFLTRHRKAWSEEDGMFAFDSDELINKYNQYTASISRINQKIEQLRQQIGRIRNRSRNQ